MFGFDNAELCCAVILAAALSFLAFLYLRKAKPPSIENRLDAVNMRLPGEPENAALHLLQAELLSRSAAPWSGIKSLERAFVLGTSAQELEPTFWSCYDSITHRRYYSDAGANYQPEPSLWRKLQSEAPTLSVIIATNISMCEAKFKARSNDITKSQDDTKRLAILNSQNY